MATSEVAYGASLFVVYLMMAGLTAGISRRLGWHKNEADERWWEACTGILWPLSIAIWIIWIIARRALFPVARTFYRIGAGR